MGVIYLSLKKIANKFNRTEYKKFKLLNWQSACIYIIDLGKISYVSMPVYFRGRLI